jgi:adenylate kinase family enzyme
VDSDEFKTIALAIVNTLCAARTALRIEEADQARLDLAQHLDRVDELLLAAYCDGRKYQREEDSNDYQRDAISEHVGMQIPGNR